MTYDRETKIATLEDAVHLIDTQNDVIADAQIIEYNQNTQIAVMQIGVSLRQKDNTCTSAYAVYRKDTQMLDMSGNPKIVQGDNTFRAQTITLDLKTQEITLDGRVQGSVTTNKNKDDASSSTTNNTPPADGAKLQSDSPDTKENTTTSEAAVK